jgi:hypothetical protein
VESPRGSPKGVIEGFLLRGATILEPYNEELLFEYSSILRLPTQELNRD